MKVIVILAIVAIAAAQSASAAPSDKVDCSPAALEALLDDMGSTQAYTLLTGKYMWPETAEELTKKCADQNEAIKTMRKHNNECYTALTKQMLSAILRTRAQHIEAQCKPDSSELKPTAEALKCLKQNSPDGVKDAEKKTILLAQALLDENVADENLRKRKACCNVITSKNHFMNAAKEKCSQHANIYSDYIDSYTSEAMGLICPEDSKLECDKLEQAKIDGVTPRNTFFLGPMIKLIKTLDH